MEAVGAMSRRITSARRGGVIDGDLTRATKVRDVPNRNTPVRIASRPSFVRLALASLALAVTVGCNVDQSLAPSADQEKPSLIREGQAKPFTWRKLAGPPAATPGLASTAHAPGSRYVYAAFMPDYGVGRLFRFDLETDRWEEVATTNWPIGKYRRLILDPVNQRLITYWDGLGQAYAVSVRGGAWLPIGNSGNSEEYYEGYSFWNPLSRSVNHFAGYGFFTFKSTLWELTSTGSWSALPTSGTGPAPRFGTRALAVDKLRNQAYIGEQVRGAAGNSDDLWQLDLATRTWKELIPLNASVFRRVGSGLTSVSPLANQLVRFGGHELTPGDPFSAPDLLVFDLARNAEDFVVVRTSGTPPEPRVGPGVFFDHPRRRVVVVSGFGANGWLDDVWAVDYPRSPIR